MRKLIFIFLMILLLDIQLTISCFGSEVWVTTPELSTREKLHRATETPSEFFKDVDLIPLHEALLSHPVSQPHLRELLSLESAAQTDAVNGRFQTAFDRYQKLLLELDQVPNVSGIEKITLESKIRIAELSGLLKLPTSGAYWKDAHAWQPEAVLSSELYSPLLIEKFRNLKKYKNFIPIKISAPPDSSVFLDGHRLKATGSFWTDAVEGGTHQISVLTPGSMWNVRKIFVPEGSTPETITFEMEPAVQGSCDSPRFIEENFNWNARLLVLFNGGACERVFDGKNWFSPKGESLDGKYLPKLELKSFQPGNFSKPETKNWLSSLTKSPWFWVGAGTVMAGSVYLFRQQQPADPEIVPSHR